MTNYLVTYDLCKPGRNYDDLIKAIKAYKSIKVTESCWLVRSNNKAEAIRDGLTKHMDANDRIYVTPVARGAAWKNTLTKGDTIIKFLDGELD